MTTHNCPDCGLLHRPPVPANISMFLGSRTTPDPLAVVTVADLWAAYTTWCSLLGVPAVSKAKLGIFLEAQGYPLHRGAAGIRARRGLSLLP